MMPNDRTLPPGWASNERWYKATFDTSERVVVYWPDAQGSIDVVGYYDSVSEANAAALGAISSGRRPRVAVNFWHSTISHVSVPPLQHRKGNDADGAIALPSWYDEEPAS